jgi:hypothetical protein
MSAAELRVEICKKNDVFSFHAARLLYLMLQNKQ